jgi:protein-disulfide isomerase
MEHQNLKHESSSNEGSQNKQSNFMIPLAIIVAGVFIAGAVIYSSGNNTGAQTAGTATVAGTGPQPTGPGAIDNIKPVTDKDHILGDPNALVKVVEFSDLECPFCKRFHLTMQQLIDEYGKDGRVAWVYRHFPLDSIHPKARKEAEATECAAELGGNAKFWAYVDRLFEVTPSNNGLDPNELSNIAEFVGIDKVKFTQCLDSGKYAQHIADDLADAINSGGTGTPFSVVIAPNGKTFAISGSQSYASVKSIVDIALQEK